MVGKLTSVRKALRKAAGQVGQKFSRRLKKKTATPGEEQKKVLMFGWELPPFNSGGLGVACYEIANSITKKNGKVTFVLPRRQNIHVPFMKVAFAEDPGEENARRNRNLKIKEIDSYLKPYINAQSYNSKEFEDWRRFHFWKRYKKYGSDLMGEVFRYGDAAAKIAKKEKFDVIHAHDWLSFPAGMKAKQVSKKPLITHVHAIEYDRCHEAGVNPAICAIEQAGLKAADKVIAVSNYTKQRIVKYYNIPAEKIEVVHNGINLAKNQKKKIPLSFLKRGGKKMVLFVGRITYQKGVDYLVKAAAKALKFNPNISFMIVGSGDMQHQLIREAAELGISDKLFFPGFLRDQNLEKIYQAADVYVMPSVSEPFGIVALEALANRVPVIISRQSGVAEVVENSLKVNFWDTDELANMIVAVLKNPSLKNTLSVNGFEDVKRCTWDSAAEKCLNIYNSLSVA